MYLLKELSSFANVSTKTLSRRIKELKESGKFTKKSKGRFYNDSECLKLSRLLSFRINNK
jgi:DeoR/GlpR family transcriptional regulator of sugar metabolism